MPFSTPPYPTGKFIYGDDSLIKKRLLVPVLAQSWVTGEEFHLIWSDRTELSESAQQVRDWIIEETKAAAMLRLP